MRTPRRRLGVGADAGALLAVQALRAFAYGLGSVIIGVTLERSGLSGAAVGAVLATVLAGTALTSLLLARYCDRLGRRRTYRLLLVAFGTAGAVFALTASLPALVIAALTGTVSTEVVESGPFTSLEQAMLPHAAEGRRVTALLALYNSTATVAGSLGALAAAAASVADGWLAPQRLLLVYPLAAAGALVAASRLSPALELGPELRGQRAPLHRSRSIVARLSALFALDSFGGGFVVQTFLAYWFARRFDASPALLSVCFFSIGLLQAASFQAASALAERLGLLRTMVFTHLPSNVLLAAIAFAPSLPIALALLFARFALSQMDVPARQAYVVGVVDASERTAAAAYTNASRYVARPPAAAAAGALMAISLGAPFLVAGLLKSLYDIGLYALFRDVALDDAFNA